MTKTTKEVLNNYSSWTLLTAVYKRHELGILYILLGLTYTLAPMHALGVF